MLYYPHLLVNDFCPFWRRIFERLAINDAPFGTHIVNGALYCLDQHISLQKDVLDIKKWLQQTLSLNIELEPEYKYFKDIRKQSLKEQLIENITHKTTYTSAMLWLKIVTKEINISDVSIYYSYDSYVKLNEEEFIAALG